MSVYNAFVVKPISICCITCALPACPFTAPLRQIRQSNGLKITRDICITSVLQLSAAALCKEPWWVRLNESVSNQSYKRREKNTAVTPFGQHNLVAHDPNFVGYRTVSHAYPACCKSIFAPSHLCLFWHSAQRSTSTCQHFPPHSPTTSPSRMDPWLSLLARGPVCWS